jgi:hypothetical protein
MRGWVCHLPLLLAIASAVNLRSESRATHDHILLPQNRNSPNLEGQVPVFISHRHRVAQLHPQALDSLFIASCDLQGYGGGIRPRLHTGIYHSHIKHRFQQFYCCVSQLPHGPRTDHFSAVSPSVRVRNLLPSNGRCLQSHCLATSLHTTIYTSIYVEPPTGQNFQFLSYTASAYDRLFVWCCVFTRMLVAQTTQCCIIR